jgi:SAM-dependent methyltransferase
MSVPEVKYWDKVAEQWSEDRSHSLWRTHSDAVNLALLQRWLPAQPLCRVLKTDFFDEACTDGLYPFLKSRARHVFGIDLSALTLGAARVRHGDVLTAAADVRTLPFTDNSFDAIISNSTLDHFQNRGEIRASMLELSRVLSPGGRLLITLDNLSNPLIALRSILPFNLLHRAGILPYQVGATCGKRKLCGMLQAAGFNIERNEWVMHCPRVLAVAITKFLGRYGSREMQRACLSALMSFEKFANAPTRSLTGYFVAVLAIKK